MFQRKAPKPPPSMALPGFERDIEANKESAAEEQGRQLTDELRSGGKNIDKAAGEMERNAPLFAGSDASPQFSLFQKAAEDKDNPVARSVSDIVKDMNAVQQELPLEERQKALDEAAARDQEFDKRLAEAQTPGGQRPLTGQLPKGTTVEMKEFRERMAARDQELDDQFAKAPGRRPSALTPTLQPEKSISGSMKEWTKANPLSQYETLADWQQARSARLSTVLEERKSAADWNVKQQMVADEARINEDKALKATRAAEVAAKAERLKRNLVSESVGQLTEQMKKLPKADKGTMLDRVSTWTKDTIDESVGRSQKTLEKVPGAFQKAWAWSKATTAAMVHDYLHPLEETDWKKVAGQKDLAVAQTALRLQDLARELKAAAPKELDRIAMTHYMEAAGNPGKLKEWQAGAKARAMQAMNDPMMTPERRRYLRDAQEHYDRAVSLTPEQKAMAQQLRQHFDDMLEVAKDNGLLEYGYRNYVMHLYEQADAANLLHLVDTNDLNPNPAALKRRFYDTFYNAEGGGLTPKSKDIAYLLTAYDKSMNDAIASRTMMRSLLDAKAPDGRPIAAIKMRGPWVIAKEGKAPQVLNQRARPASLEGYRDFDRPQLRNFLFKPTTDDLEGFDPKLFDEDPERLAFRGDLIIHPKYASQVEDLLTPSWFERGETIPQKIGKGVQQVSGLAKELMTAVAPFHMVQ